MSKTLTMYLMPGMLVGACMTPAALDCGVTFTNFLTTSPAEARRICVDSGWTNDEQFDTLIGLIQELLDEGVPRFDATDSTTLGCTIVQIDSTQQACKSCFNSLVDAIYP